VGCLLIYSHLDSFRVSFGFRVLVLFREVLVQLWAVIRNRNRPQTPGVSWAVLRIPKDGSQKIQENRFQAGNRDRGSPKLGKDQETAGSYSRSVPP